MSNPKSIYLKDYNPPAYLIDTIDLYFDLDEARTRVRATLAMRRNAGVEDGSALHLNGEKMLLKSVHLNGLRMDENDYTLTSDCLILHHVPAAFELIIETEINPSANTALEGLYLFSDNFCTQCEAEGFRKITYFLDRPDVMARYTTTIVADKKKYPVLLSNGNPIESGELENNRHWVRWEDPFKKPAYLFALVAGNLLHIEESYVTASGRTVTLRIYVEPQNIDKCGHAMASLRKAMRWDEEVYGLEYDLDIFMIVAVGDFNMGAMENKGLNIFNSKYILARPETATDGDYEGIESVVAHEYFHNWTGNRVTCRDWFQLSLKEGLTVFRDQEFSAEMGSRAVQRISDVRTLRAAQFPEDAGPMAHPVRPESYMEINNFYTATVYEKGAELIRMMQALLGPAAFRKGMDLYFARHDGCAVTTDDFVAAMEDASEVDLTQFQYWYSQAGTPVLHVQGDYDPQAKTYLLRVRQSCPPTPGQAEKQAQHIPLRMALLDGRGWCLPLHHGDDGLSPIERVLNIRQVEEQFLFTQVPEEPVPSLLRGFSAPVRLVYPYTRAERIFLMGHDSDPFNRWEAGQQLLTEHMLERVAAHRAGHVLELDPELADAMEKVLRDPGLDKAFVAEMLSLPSEEYLGDQMAIVDVDAIHAVRLFMRRELATRLRAQLWEGYQRNRDEAPYQYTPALAGQRRLKNMCLGYLLDMEDEEALAQGLAQFRNADNMTDAFWVLGALTHLDRPERAVALQEFQERWRDEPLVMDKWFSIQAVSRLPSTLENIKSLLSHPGFDIKNPNKVRALIGAFSHSNPLRFHDPDGAGYAFLVDQILLLNPLNPQIAARLTGALSRWKRYNPKRQQMMKHQLERLVNAPDLSGDVYEIVNKSLNG